MIKSKLFLAGNSDIERPKSVADNTNNIVETAERNAMLSLSAKEHSIDLRRSELNLVEELKKYRRSTDLAIGSKAVQARKTKSI